jgi:hypothetical protein
VTLSLPAQSTPEARSNTQNRDGFDVGGLRYEGSSPASGAGPNSLIHGRRRWTSGIVRAPPADAEKLSSPAVAGLTSLLAYYFVVERPVKGSSADRLVPVNEWDPFHLDRETSTSEHRSHGLGKDRQVEDSGAVLQVIEIV